MDDDRTTAQPATDSRDWFTRAAGDGQRRAMPARRPAPPARPGERNETAELVFRAIRWTYR